MSFVRARSGWYLARSSTCRGVNWRVSEIWHLRGLHKSGGRPMFLPMPWVEVQISVRGQGLVADLEIVAPPDVDVTALLGGALASVRARALSYSVVQTSQRLIARVRVTNGDGSRISPARADQLLDVARTALYSAGMGAFPGQAPRWWATGPQWIQPRSGPAA
jgi:hypothetical protein